MHFKFVIPLPFRDCWSFAFYLVHYVSEFNKDNFLVQIYYLYQKSNATKVVKLNKIRHVVQYMIGTQLSGNKILRNNELANC